MATITIEITQESGARCFDVRYIEINAKGEEIGEETSVNKICSKDTLTLDLDAEKKYELRFYRRLQFPWKFYKFLRVVPKEGAESTLLILLATITIKNAEEMVIE